MRKRLLYAFAGGLFFFFQITGHDLAVQGNLDWTVQYTLFTLLCSAAGGVCVAMATQYVQRLIAPRSGASGDTPAVKNGASGDASGENTRGTAGRSGGLRSWQAGLISFVLLLLCWLPCYLAYYPGICAYDVTIQTGQIVSGSYNDHHPIAHTLLLSGSMRLGQALFGDVNTGIGLLVFVQLVLLAGVFAWGVALLHRRGVGRPALIGLQVFGMVYPFHMYMSVSVIKDVWFSMWFLLQVLAMSEVLRRRNRKPDRYDLLFFVSSVGMQLFRNNGRYALLVLLVGLAAAVLFGKGHRRLWGKLCVNALLAFVVGSLCLTGLFRVTHAKQGDRREMLSMPIQQLARCMLYHGGVGVLEADDGTMGAQDRALIADFLLDEGYQYYRPEISDPVKSHTNTYVVRYRAGEFARTYLRLLGSYPGDFVNAALAVNAGYLYLGDTSHATVNQNGVDAGLGYVQTRWVEAELNPRGIYKDSKWESLHALLERLADENAYLKIPVLRYLCVPAIILWLYLALLAKLLADGQYAKCLPLLLVFGYYLTLFLGPVVQLRYLYPLILALPFLAVCSLEKQMQIVIYKSKKRRNHD
ncbi:MAG: hypothetical protein IJ747_08195 [Lachnospiraceae bacterium]|nr:hypothetical protein [Lachnospiraceae bacterium]